MSDSGRDSIDALCDRLIRSGRAKAETDWRMRLAVAAFLGGAPVVVGWGDSLGGVACLAVFFWPAALLYLAYTQMVARRLKAREEAGQFEPGSPADLAAKFEPSRNCPVCDAPVPLRRRLWRRPRIWPCRACGSELSVAPPGALAFVAGASGGLLGPILLELDWPITLAGFGAILLCCGIASLLDPVRVARRPNACYCPSCQYDLRGTIEAGRAECPECGQALDVETPENEG